MARVPVCSVWQPEVGPMLSLGLLTANARAHDGGALNEHYDIGRPDLAEPVLERLAEGSGPAILLCSNYVWSLEYNLDVARRALALRPDLLVVHGGPSTPKYPGDVATFLSRHRDVAGVLVHGEGEVALCELLTALVASDTTVDRSVLAGVAGISFLDGGTGEVVRTADRPRVADLDQLVSPYLSGEFDHIDPAAWRLCASIETNRGCPYGCTFCDWGSATLARIRSFGVGRVAAEIEWCAARGIFGLQLCDANFGILRRDIEVAESIAASAERHGSPTVVAFTPAKNTTRHLSRIFDVLLSTDVRLSTAISLQTTDPTTLDLVQRSNISIDAYLALAADLRRRGQPLQGDVLVGLPGQTYDTYRRDLQFFMDHDIVPRTWMLRLLPNAPMNDPTYRREHDIRADDHDVVVSTATMSAADRARMQRLRKTQLIAWRYGVIRPLLHVLQWDHGVEATVVLDAIATATSEEPSRYPRLSWLFEYFDLYQGAALGWSGVLDEVVALVADRFGIGPSSALRTAVDVVVAVMPAPGRELPATVRLDHDFPAYVRSASRSLFDTGSASAPDRPLSEYPPVTLTVTGDPERVCTDGPRLRGDPRSDVIEGDFWIEPWLRFELPTSPELPSAAAVASEVAA